MHPCLSHFTQRLSDRRDPRVRQQMNERAVISQQNSTVWRRKLCHVQYGWTGGTVLTGANQPRETDALWLHWHRSVGRADPEKAGRRLWDWEEGERTRLYGTQPGAREMAQVCACDSRAERWTGGPWSSWVSQSSQPPSSGCSERPNSRGRAIQADTWYWPLTPTEVSTVVHPSQGKNSFSSAEWMTLGWRHGSGVKRTCCSSKGLEFVPSTHVGQLTTSCDASSRGLMTSSGFYRHLH